MRFLLALVALCLSVSAHARFETDFPAPDDAHLTIVGLDMKLNGIRMSSWELRSKQPAERIIDFYARTWPARSKDDPGHTIAPMGDWKLLTHIDIDRGLVYSVQVRPEGPGSFGLLAVTDILKGEGVAPDSLARDFPRVGGSTVESVLEAQDDGISSRTITLSNPQSIQQTVDHYINAFTRRGWTIEKAVVMKDSGDGAVVATSGADRVNIAVVRYEGQSRTVAVWEQRR